MTVAALDPYYPAHSPIHSLDGRVKLPLVILYVLTVSLTPPGGWPTFILLFALLLSVELWSDVPYPIYLRRSLIALPFALAAVPLLFTTPGHVLLTLPFQLSLTSQGLSWFLSVLLKSWLSVQAVLLLTATTPFPHILTSLRAIKIPRLLVSIFSLMWRYLFVMVEEVQRMLRARSSRSAVLPGYRAGGSLAWRARGTGAMAGTLLLRSLDRSDRIYSAMLARGYDGEVRSLAHPPLKRSAWLVLGTGTLFLLLILALSALFYR